MAMVSIILDDVCIVKVGSCPLVVFFDGIFGK